uniref:Uncharacterized protein n=1 Tax=Cajanus cajan TaxID=3821 RepID=A0A151SIE1_CAJCA|nr:hypothetical protein KK1_000738 [Cajanus cajan]
MVWIVRRCGHWISTPTWRVREVFKEVERKVLKTRNDHVASGGGAYLAAITMPYDRPKDMRLREEKWWRWGNNKF